MSGPAPSCLCGTCKLCKMREYMRLYRERHRDDLNSKRRAWRAANPGRDAAALQRYVLRNQEKVRERERARKRDPEKERARYERRKQQADWLEKKRDWMRGYREKYAEHARAHSLLQDAVRTGKIVRQPCEVCGKPGADGHHEDYAKPLDVRWLCRSHHRQLHIARRAT